MNWRIMKNWYLGAECKSRTLRFTSRTFIFSFEKLIKTYFHRSLLGYKWVWAEWWPMHIYRVRRIELFLYGNCCVGLWLQLKFIQWNMIQLINVTIKAIFFLLVPLKILVLVPIASLLAASPVSWSVHQWSFFSRHVGRKKGRQEKCLCLISGPSLL